MAILRPSIAFASVAAKELAFPTGAGLGSFALTGLRDAPFLIESRSPPPELPCIGAGAGGGGAGIPSEGGAGACIGGGGGGAPDNVMSELSLIMIMINEFYEPLEGGGGGRAPGGGGGTACDGGGGTACAGGGGIDFFAGGGGAFDARGGGGANRCVGGPSDIATSPP